MFYPICRLAFLDSGSQNLSSKSDLVTLVSLPFSGGGGQRHEASLS